MENKENIENMVKENMLKIHDIQLNFFRDKGYCVNSDGLIGILNKVRLFDENEIENIVRCAFEIEQLFKKSNSQFGLSSIVGKHAVDKWRQIKKNIIQSELQMITSSLSSKVNSVDIETNEITKGEFIVAMILSGYNPKILKKSIEDISVFFDAIVITKVFR
jgi:hypothetical protein